MYPYNPAFLPLSARFVSTYAIGDIQGCYDELRSLLDRIGFAPSRDRLWLVGDLVNRGPRSLEVLRYVRSLGSAAVVVLGNHDLHLVALAKGHARAREDDTLEEVLRAPDSRDLIAWVQSWPLIHVEGGRVMVHAGLLPSWSVPTAQALAGEVERTLRGAAADDFIAHLYGSRPDRWNDALTGHDRLRVTVNAMTRMRFCSPEGVMEFQSKGETRDAPPGYLPWFDVPGRQSAAATLVVGHWSALGYLQRPDLIALDSGCVWGGALSAVCLEDGRLFQVPCPRRD